MAVDEIADVLRIRVEAHAPFIVSKYRSFPVRPLWIQTHMTAANIDSIVT
jgi:hypothetical protein